MKAEPGGALDDDEAGDTADEQEDSGQGRGNGEQRDTGAVDGEVWQPPEHHPEVHDEKNGNDDRVHGGDVYTSPSAHASGRRSHRDQPEPGFRGTVVTGDVAGMSVMGLETVSELEHAYLQQETRLKLLGEVLAHVGSVLSGNPDPDRVRELGGLLRSLSQFAVAPVGSREGEVLLWQPDDGAVVS